MSAAQRRGVQESVRSLWLAEEHAHIEQRRVQRMRVFTCVIMATLAFGWSCFFAWTGQWLIVASLLFLMCSAVATFLLLQGRGVGAVTDVLVFGSVMVVVSGIALLCDGPDRHTPRSVHLFLLPLAVASFMAFRYRKPWQSYVISGLSLALFLALTVTTWTPFPELTFPEHVRDVGKWLNGAAAMLVMLMLLHVLHTDASQHSSMERAMQTALHEEQFVLHFQPQLNQAQQVTGAEVLVRWQHPQRGLLPPGVFIDHAERNGLMVPLGQWILEKTCDLLHQWQQDPLLRHLDLAVNVSQTQFRQESFVPDVLGAVARHGIDTDKLELELTETLMVLNMEELQQKMQALRDVGIRFSLDDFGTGFSSLSHLRQLPLQTLKIDRSFVTDLPHESNSTTIVQTLLGLAKSMQLTVVAEGIETAAQRDCLLSLGIDVGQGFLYAPGLDAEAMGEWLHRYPAAPLAAQDALAASR